MPYTVPTNVQQHSYTVKPEDTPDFGDGPLHPVMSTYTLAREAEWAGRLFALQLKNDHQEGIGSAITIKHRAPAFIGQTIKFEARCTHWDGKRLDCSFVATVDDVVIAEGTTGQVILPKEQIKQMMGSKL